MCLTKFFCKSNCKSVSLDFSKKEQFADSAVALNKTKRDFLNWNKTVWTPCSFAIASTH